MNFFWPKYTKIGATPGVRVGRLLHWCGLAVAAFFAFGATLHLVDGSFNNFFGFIGIALVPAMIGRGLRYLFAGE